MYASYWGLQRSPFIHSFSPEWFILTPQHEEALARLSFVVEQSRQVAVMTGPAGAGKTFILHLFASQVDRAQRRAVSVNLAGLNSSELMRELACGLQLDDALDSPDGRVWRSIADSIEGWSHSGIQTVLLLDNLDRAEPDCRLAVQRLTSLRSHATRPLVLIAAVRHPTTAAAHWLDEAIDLVVELEPLSATETASFVTELLARAGRRTELFTSEALRVLHDVTDGVPGRICRLADLCLLAAMGRDQSFVDAGLVGAAAEELARLPASPAA